MEEGNLSRNDSVFSGDNRKKKRKRKRNSKNTKHGDKTGGKAEVPGGWTLSGMTKGSVTSRCLWTACRAVFIGAFFIIIGAAMATLGFYAKILSTSSVHRGNVTVFVTDEAKFMHLDNLTYVGPCIMGIGGVIIVGACVMTFEARDTASKITPWFKFPAWTKYSKVEVHPPKFCKNENSMCNPNSELEVAKLRIKADFMQFKDKVENNLQGGDLVVAKPKNGKLTRSSTDPNLVGGLKPVSKSCDSKDHSLNLPAKTQLEGSNLLQVCHPNHKMLRRQAVSVDYNSEFPPVQRSYSNSSSKQKFYKRGDSDDSMVMDLYLPQGSVTLKIRDTSKRAGSSSSLQRIKNSSECSQENRRSMSPVLPVTHQKFPPSGLEDCLLSVPTMTVKNRLKLEKSHSSDGGPRLHSKSAFPKQRLMMEGKSQSSDDGFLRVPSMRPMEMSSRGSSISSEDSFRTPSPKPFNKHRFSGSSISSEEGSTRHPNLSMQSGSYSSQDSYTILESPHEGAEALAETEDILHEIPTRLPLQPQALDRPNIKKFQSVQEPRPSDLKLSDEGHRRAGQYRSKTESAKRHPLLRQTAVDS